MRVREKLNMAFIHGSVMLAAVLGWLTGSWLIFVVALIGLVAGSVYVGEIRWKK